MSMANINLKEKISTISNLVKFENIDEIKKRVEHDDFQLRLSLGSIIANGCAMGKTELVDELLKTYPRKKINIDLIYYCINNERYDTLKHLMLDYKNRVLGGIGEGDAYITTLKAHMEKCVIDDNIKMLYILLAFNEYDLLPPVVDDLICDAIRCESVNVFKVLLDSFDHTSITIEKEAIYSYNRHKMAIIADHHNRNLFLRQGKKLVNGRVEYTTH